LYYKELANDGYVVSYEKNSNPDTQTLGKFETKQKQFLGERQEQEQYRGKPTISKSGQKINLYANIGSVTAVEAALSADAEGICLFRGELLCLGRDDYPGEDIQYESYRKAAEFMGGRQVIIRTMDIEADKQAEYFDLPKEENPALGKRAIRICLTRTSLFKT
jgi:phosphotransferase system enzyme I (PtsI)